MLERRGLVSREGEDQGSEDGMRGEIGKLNWEAPCSLTMPGETGGKMPAGGTAHRKLRQEKALDFSLKVVSVGLLYSIHALSLVMEAVENVMQC